MTDYTQYGFNKSLTKRETSGGRTLDHSVSGKTIEQATITYVIPRKTTAQRDAMGSLTKGQMIFNTDTEELDIWDGVQWVSYSGTSTSTSSISTSSSSTSSTVI